MYLWDECISLSSRMTKNRKRHRHSLSESSGDRASSVRDVFCFYKSECSDFSGSYASGPCLGVSHPWLPWAHHSDIYASLCSTSCLDKGEAATVQSWTWNNVTCCCEASRQCAFTSLTHVQSTYSHILGTWEWVPSRNLRWGAKSWVISK